MAGFGKADAATDRSAPGVWERACAGQMPTRIAPVSTSPARPAAAPPAVRSRTRSLGVTRLSSFGSIRTAPATGVNREHWVGRGVSESLRTQDTERGSAQGPALPVPYLSI